MSTAPDGKRFGSPLPEVMPFIMAGEDYLLAREMKQSCHEIIRRVYMRRRLLNGEYEDEWQEIDPRRIMKYGSTKVQIDAIKVNFYDQSGIQIQFDNTDGFFSDESFSGSFWNGYFSVYRTLVKVSMAYYDNTTQTEFPEDPILLYGILSDEPTLGRDNTASIKFNALSTVFSEVAAKDLPINTAATQTADRFVHMVKNYQDGNGVYIFQKFFSSTAWNIQTGTATYPNLNTNTAVGGDTCLQFLQKLAMAENRVIYIGPNGDFNFVGRNAGSTSVYDFNGGARFLSGQANSILTIDNYTKKVQKTYNRIRVKYLEPSTETSYYTKAENWTWGDSSSSFIYGVRQMPDIVNTWLNTASAISIGDAVFSEFQYPKNEIQFSAKYYPSINPLDRFTVSYVLSGDDVNLWGQVLWGQGYWQGFTHNEFSQKNFYAISIHHDLDKIQTQIIGRETS